VVVQNSLREGFGLTATEAMFKRVAFIGTEQACGLRTQVRNGVDGILIGGDPSDPRNVAAALNEVLGNDCVREKIAVNGQKRVYDKFLIFRQMQEWLTLALRLLQPAEAAAEAAELRGTLRREASITQAALEMTAHQLHLLGHGGSATLEDMAAAHAGKPDAELPHARCEQQQQLLQQQQQLLQQQQHQQRAGELAGAEHAARATRPPGLVEPTPLDTPHTTSSEVSDDASRYSSPSASSVASDAP
jgi:hypothetical protein